MQQPSIFDSVIYPFSFFTKTLFFTMEDLFKKFVNAGVGYIAQGSKSVQSTIEKLVKDSKMTEHEGKKILEELLKSGETKRLELEKQFQGLADRVKTTVGLGAAKRKPAAKKAASKKAAAKNPAAKAPAAKTAAKPAASASTAAKKAPAKASAAAASKPAAKPAAKKTASKPAAAKKPAAAAAPKDNGQV